ncbi:hypothetical protein ACFCX0_36610 [Streptomyces sp. NPDC056352]|uniref:hypothetical protein n=1 Tax=Streptomyces sp. NPDC056352 TaxID=3345791 RepID=UPI0035DB875B
MRHGANDRPTAVRMARPAPRDGWAPLRWTAPALGLAALALSLAGCGVPPSEVIDVGKPATGMSPATEVYFLTGDTGTSQSPKAHSPGTSSPDGDGGMAAADPSVAGGATPRTATGAGSLHAVPRPAASGTDPVSYAVRQLVAGPTAVEAAGLTTALPPVMHPSRITVETGRHADTVVIRFPAGTDRLTEPALRQLACTAARAHRAAERSAGGETGTRSSAVPAPATVPVPAARAPVEVQVTDRHPAGNGEPGAGWEVTVTDDACPS